uniref:dual-specificity kinase n=1 Tax=Meloidogyne hapla TaxID=6305 RepID=A0A1I8B606_MELHA
MTSSNIVFIRQIEDVDIKKISKSTQNLTISGGKTFYRSDEAIKLFGSKLTAFEFYEIKKYKRIYFVGQHAKKRINFDDEEDGVYSIVLHDHLDYRYEIIKPIGRGSFGNVVKAFDHKKHQADEEIKILDILKKQDVKGGYNIIPMLEHFTFRNHKCITFKLLSMNLYELLKKNKFEGFRLTLVRKFAISILHCLELLYLNKIIHTDLKPENILLETPTSSSIKIADFGCSFFEGKKVYSYFQSRYYRAPEVILGGKIGMSLDMWSFGCILAELLTGSVLLPGNNEGDQLALMIELLGKPDEKFLEKVTRKNEFFNSKGKPIYCEEKKEKTILKGGTRGKLRGAPGSKTWEDVLNDKGDEFFLDFLKLCLDWNPETRLTPIQAFKHPWLSRRLPFKKLD